MLAPWFYKTKTEAGIDEAGRGCYAGPVFAAAVILPKNFYHPLLNDSKQVSEKHREQLREIIEKESIAWSVAQVDNLEIDKINILQASFKAMHLALDQLKIRPAHLLVDGNRFRPYPQISHHCIIKGDGLYAPIAAASILAKTHRDAFMQKLHAEFDYYGWDANKGYGTAKHRKAISSFGLSKYHRKSFHILSEPPALFTGR